MVHAPIKLYGNPKPRGRPRSLMPVATTVTRIGDEHAARRGAMLQAQQQGE